MYRHFAAKNYPMVTGCCQGSNLDGLISGHAYSLLDVKDLKDASGTVVHTIAKVRNPWATERYYGKWSDDDSSWTDDFKKQVDYVNADDGAFWMPFDKFMTSFFGVGVAFYEPYKGYSVEKLLLKEQNTYITFENPTDQMLYITLEHYSPRNLPRSCQDDTEHAWAYMYNSDYQQIGKMSNGYTGTEGFATFGDWTGKVPKGKYTIYAYNYNANVPLDATLHVYASEEAPKMNY